MQVGEDEEREKTKGNDSLASICRELRAEDVNHLLQHTYTHRIMSVGFEKVSQIPASLNHNDTWTSMRGIAVACSQMPASGI